MKGFLIALRGSTQLTRRNVCIGLGTKLQLIIKNITTTKYSLDLVLLVGTS